MISLQQIKKHYGEKDKNLYVTKGRTRNNTEGPKPDGYYNGFQLGSVNNIKYINDTFKYLHLYNKYVGKWKDFFFEKEE